MIAESRLSPPYARRMHFHVLYRDRLQRAFRLGLEAARESECLVGTINQTTILSGVMAPPRSDRTTGPLP
jgi:hypothetical protein